MKPTPPRPAPTHDDGGPAHPSPALSYATDERGRQRDGMSMRDFFAGQAIAGLAANPKNDEMIRGIAHWPSMAAQWAYRVADAVLDERAKGRQA